MKKNMTNCESCGGEIAVSAKSCPQCGAKVKRPVTKKWWFWAIIVVVVLGIIGGVSGSNSESKPNTNTQSGTEEPISYTHYNVTELFDALSSNAMKAQSDFKDQYVEIEGYLSVVDSDGKYISVGAAPNDYSYIFQTVQCYIKNDTQKQQIMEISTDSPIVVRGRITSVGEVLGFSMNIDSIN